MTKKICSKCNKEINEKEDSWYENKLFNKGEEKSVIYFHRECYKKFHKDKFEEVYKEKMGKLMPILKKVLPVNIGGITQNA
ncbi:MAG: hypothetical protein ACOC5T_01750 [Elusimicrobiota bacterium]